MKLYVDELPKCCAECEWFTPNHCGGKNERNFCLIARMPFYNTEEDRKATRGQNKDSFADFDCSLQSLAEHDKQVRKDICEEIRKTGIVSFDALMQDEEYFITGCDLEKIEKGGSNAERKESKSNSRQ